MMFINGKNHSQWAGAWTILNMHEIAIVSGFSAAYRLGAKYPFADNDDCKRLFALYLGASHGKRMVRRMAPRPQLPALMRFMTAWRGPQGLLCMSSAVYLSVAVRRNRPYPLSRLATAHWKKHSAA